MKDKLRVQDTPGTLRQKGWVVAVHNDYRQNGRLMTFWLFTKDDRCVKGEGATDLEALAEVVAAVKKIEVEEHQAMMLSARILQLEDALRPFAEAAEELDRSNDGWDDRARQKNTWFFDDAVIRAASRTLRHR